MLDQDCRLPRLGSRRALAAIVAQQSLEASCWSSVTSRPVYKNILFEFIRIYLNKSYLFVIYALVKGVFLCYLFKIDWNTIWIHSRQTRGDGRGKNGSNKTTELHVDPLKKLSTSNMGIYIHHCLECSKSIVAETIHRGSGGGRFRCTSSCRHTSTWSAWNMNTFKCIQKVSIQLATSIHILFICTISE